MILGNNSWLFFNAAFLMCDVDCIHHILCDKKTCLGLWKTGIDTKGRPGVRRCYFLQIMNLLLSNDNL